MTDEIDKLARTLLADIRELVAEAERKGWEEGHSAGYEEGYQDGCAAYAEDERYDA